MKDSSFQKEDTMAIKSKGTWLYFNCFIIWYAWVFCLHAGVSIHFTHVVPSEFRRASGPLSLELQVAVTPLLQVLGVEPRSSPRAVSMLQP